MAQHQVHEDLRRGNTVEARDLLAPPCPSLVSRPDFVQRSLLPSQDTSGALSTLLRLAGCRLGGFAAGFSRGPVRVLPCLPECCSLPVRSRPLSPSLSSRSRPHRSRCCFLLVCGSRGSSAFRLSPSSLRSAAWHSMADIVGAPNRRVPFRIRSIQPLLRRPTQLRGWVKHSRAPRRHRIWKVTLVDTLFNLLDSLNV